jgi:hypothetical protein
MSKARLEADFPHLRLLKDLLPVFIGQALDLLVPVS